MNSIQSPRILASALRELGDALDELPAGFYVMDSDCPGTLCFDLVNRSRTLGLGVCVCFLSRDLPDTLQHVAQVLGQISVMNPTGPRTEGRGTGG